VLTVAEAKPIETQLRDQAGADTDEHNVRSDFELNFGRYLPAFGRADGDDAHTQPD
jgi:hypothetical protein